MSLVITGSPGVGKHTIGERIAKIMDLELVDLNRVALDEGVFEKGGESMDVDVDALRERLKPRLGPKSLIVGHLAPYVLTRQQIRMAIVLRKSPYALSAIYGERNYSKTKIGENIEGEILGIIAHDMIECAGNSRVVQIDTTAKSVRQVVLQARDAIDGKKSPDAVDWLSAVSEKDDLRTFFSYD